MKALAIIVNIFLPGIGTLIVKKFGQGIAQIVLGIIAALLTITGILSIIGIPLGIGVWIWAIVSAATAEDQPVTVIVQQPAATETSTTESENK